MNEEKNNENNLTIKSLAVVLIMGLGVTVVFATIANYFMNK